jgi:hypothetical protein
MNARVERRGERERKSKHKTLMSEECPAYFNDTTLTCPALFFPDVINQQFFSLMDDDNTTSLRGVLSANEVAEILQLKGHTCMHVNVTHEDGSVGVYSTEVADNRLVYVVIVGGVILIIVVLLGKVYQEKGSRRQSELRAKKLAMAQELQTKKMAMTEKLMDTLDRYVTNQTEVSPEVLDIFKTMLVTNIGSIGADVADIEQVEQGS